MTFSRWIFRAAGIFGLVVLLPQYFLEKRFGEDYPPPLNHAENFYGFLGVAIAWQIAFLVIAQNPVRYRPFMLVGVLEKLSFGIACVVLFIQGRLADMILGFGIVDLIWAVLFLIAWWKTREKDA